MQAAKLPAVAEASRAGNGRGAQGVPTRIMNDDLANRFFAVQP
jgi:hypothetical protein